MSSPPNLDPILHSHQSYSGHVQFPDGTNDAPLHSAMAHSGHHPHEKSAGFPRTRTSSSGGNGTVSGGYRRKVGFEAFEEAGETALFAFTVQVSSLSLVASGC